MPCAEEDKLEVVAGITSAYDDHECSTVDGVRVRFNDDDGNYVGWYLARKSNTEAVLVMRMEATSEEQLTKMKEMADERVSSIIDIKKLLNA